MASTYLKRDITSDGNKKIFTFSMWVKRGTLGSEQRLLMGYDAGSGEEFFQFNSNDKMKFASSNGTLYLSDVDSTRVFRDTSAWYHLVLAYDSTQATDTNRIKLYVNGEQETIDSSPGGFPSQNTDILFWNTSGDDIDIGGRSELNNLYFDGQMSHIHFIDGTAYDATAFGEYDANGVWKINTSPSVTYGTNGFFILKNGNSVTDQSGNGNNFTVAGGTLTNTEDSPSNVFATLNPLVNNAGEMMALTKGNLTCESTTTSPAWKLAVSTLGMTSGKYYWEVKFDNVHNCYNTGIMGSNLLTANTSNIMSQIGYTGFYNNDGGEFRVDNTDTTVDYGLYNTGDIMGIACDMDNYTIAFYKNGVSHVSSQSISTTGRDIVFPCSIHYQTNGGVQASYNFGNGYFGTTAISSAGTNASGNGIFEYDVPTGYTALSTKGLNL